MTKKIINTNGFIKVYNEFTNSRINKNPTKIDRRK
jgi:hypothetical protein